MNRSKHVKKLKTWTIIRSFIYNVENDINFVLDFDNLKNVNEKNLNLININGKNLALVW
jgi:hypothetical protein